MVREVRRQTDDAQIHPHAHESPDQSLGYSLRRRLQLVWQAATAGFFSPLAALRLQRATTRWRPERFILMSKIWVGSPKPSAMRHLLRQPTHHLVRREQSPRTRLPTSPERTSRSLLPVNPVPQQVAGPSCQRPKQKSWRSTLLAGRLQVGRSKWTSQFNRDPNEARA